MFGYLSQEAGKGVKGSILESDNDKVFGIKVKVHQARQKGVQCNVLN